MNIKQSISVKQYLIIALGILVLCFLLFSFDRETHHFTDLLTPGNLVALVVYFVPTYVISLLLNAFFIRKFGTMKSAVLAISTGALIGFFLVINAFLMFRP